MPQETLAGDSACLLRPHCFEPMLVRQKKRLWQRARRRPGDRALEWRWVPLIILGTGRTVVIVGKGLGLLAFATLLSVCVGQVEDSLQKEAR